MACNKSTTRIKRPTNIQNLMIKIISEKEPDLAVKYFTRLNKITNRVQDKNSDVLYISLRKLLKEENLSKSDLIVGFKMYLDENYTDVQIIKDLTMQINHTLSSRV